MSNTISPRPDGILLSVYQPEQTYETIKDVSERTRVEIERLRAQGKPVRILIDISQVKTQDIGARKAALEGITSLEFDKMAVFGAGLFIKHVAGFVIQAAGKSEMVKYFDTEKEATEWLIS